MNKKEKLTLQKKKQDEINKKLQLEEKKLKENIKQSESSKKFLKSEPTVYIVFKFLMLIPFAWSGFYWGGIFLIGIFANFATPLVKGSNHEKIMAIYVAVGIALIIAGIVFAFLKKYIISFIPILLGTISFLVGAHGFIQPLKDYIKEHADTELENFAASWEIRLYPIIFVFIISLMLFGLKLITSIMNKKEKRKEYNNSPVKSIIEE